MIYQDDKTLHVATKHVCGEVQIKNRKIFSKINENNQYIIWEKYVKICILIDETGR